MKLIARFTFVFRYRNHTEVSLDPELKGRYEIVDAEYKFIISKPREEDAAWFQCKEPTLGLEAEFRVAGKFTNLVAFYRIFLM